MTDTEQSRAGAARRGAEWERELLQRLAADYIEEKRRARRWGIFFKLFFAAYLVALFVVLQSETVAPIRGKHTALVDMTGVLGPEEGVTAETVIRGLEAAYEEENAVGVILRVNSPGGSPVQAGRIHSAIVRLREEHPDRPLYAVIDDVCASGCYYAVASADKIFADRASIVGSIGVLMDAFGFVETLKKLGIERRLITAGENKALFDPFSPMTDKARTHAQRLLDEIHQQFIAAVKSGRGEQLADDREIFSGLFWTGEQAKDLGLVDELGDADYVAREILGTEEIVNYTPEEDLFERLAERFGLGVARALGLDAAEAVRLR